MSARSILAMPSDESPLRGPLALLGAFALHAAIALAPRPAAAPPPDAAPLEIELPPPPVEPAPPPPEPPSAPEPPTKTAAAPAPAPIAARPAAHAAAARAGNVLTQAPNAAPSEDILDFVTDPSGASYGSGTVMRGGTAAAASGPVAASPTRGVGTGRGPVGDGDAIVSPEHLSRRARLGERDVCSGFFPRDADADVAEVTVVAVVRANGAVASVTVAAESPRGQGFGAAARRCLGASRFEPALDERGQAVSSAPTVKVRFSR